MRSPAMSMQVFLTTLALATGAAGAWAQLPVLGTIPLGALPTTESRELVDVGDVDGDGRHDVLLVRRNVLGGSSPPAILYSSGSGAVLQTLLPPAGSAFGFGHDADAIGDLDGDGITEIAIGDFVASRTVVYSGGSGGLLFTVTEGGALGSSVSRLGDVNADGVPDFVVGNPFPQPPLSAPGHVLVVSGATGGTLATLVGPSVGDAFGTSLGAGPDLDGDGIPEIVVGSPREANGGAVRIFSGATGALVLGPITNPRFGVPLAAQEFGAEVVVIEDVDGDGVADLVASATPTGFSSGQRFLATISSATGAVVDVITEGVFAQLRAAGDVNGDGRGDFMMTDVSAAATRVWSGRDGSVLADVPATAACGLGDANGDGFADVVVIDPASAPPATASIRAVVGARRHLVSPDAIQTLDLSWTPGAAAALHAGAVVASGAVPFAPGIFLVGEAPDASVVSGAVLAVDVVSSPWAAAPITFDGAGTFTAPVDLLVPLLTGRSFFTQSFASATASPIGVATSNGLELRFGHSRAVPVIDSITPASPLPGASVTVTGRSFAAGATLSIAGQSVSLTSVANTSFTFVQPAGLGCDALLRLTNPDGTRASAMINQTPVIASYQPVQASFGGGGTISIQGSGFVPGTVVTIGGANAQVLSLSPDHLLAAVPPGAPGATAVVVTGPAGCSATVPFTYVIPVPTVTAITPFSPAPGTLVTLEGHDFAPGMTVAVGGAPVTLVALTSTAASFVNPTSQCDAPVLLTNPNGLQALVYLNPSNVIALIQPGTTTAAGLMLTVWGAFDPSSTVTVDGVPVSAAIATLVFTITVPLAPSGTTAIIAVTSPSGCSSPTAFTYP